MATDDSPKSERLVSYLDGELGEEAAAEVEQQLAREPTVRQEVEQLARTYEMLDLLPAARAPEDFSQKTITAIQSKSFVENGEAGEAETVLVEVSTARPERPAGRWRDRVSRWGVRAVGLLGFLFVASVGFNSTFKRDTSDLDLLLRDFPIIERLNQYREAGSLEFLEQLKDSELFDENQQADSDTTIDDTAINDTVGNSDEPVGQ